MFNQYYQTSKLVNIDWCAFKINHINLRVCLLIFYGAAPGTVDLIIKAPINVNIIESSFDQYSYLLISSHSTKNSKLHSLNYQSSFTLVSFPLIQSFHEIRSSWLVHNIRGCIFTDIPFQLHFDPSAPLILSHVSFIS